MRDRVVLCFACRWICMRWLFQVWPLLRLRSRAIRCWTNIFGNFATVDWRSTTNCVFPPPSVVVRRHFRHLGLIHPNETEKKEKKNQNPSTLRRLQIGHRFKNLLVRNFGQSFPQLDCFAQLFAGLFGAQMCLLPSKVRLIHVMLLL